MKNKDPLRIFLIGFFLVVIFWFGRSHLEDFLVFEMTKGEVGGTNNFGKEFIEDFRPFRFWSVENLKINARAAISIEINKDGRRITLFEKNKDERLPIASLTKLMTALIAFEKYNLEEEVVISNRAILNNEMFFKQGEVFAVRDLLYSVLMESNNVAAQALAEKMGEGKFIALMNGKAVELGLTDTHFYNVTGLDSNNFQGSSNSSTCKDLTNLVAYILKEKPFIWEISKNLEYELYDVNGIFHHRVENTNKLLNKWPDILGGKTGWTPIANGCLVMVMENPVDDGFIVNVILGSQNRFEEMENLINWLYRAYKW